MSVAALQGHDLIIGNIGDSRAILGTRDEDDALIAVQLTVDLKPNLPSWFLFRSMFCMVLGITVFFFFFLSLHLY